MDGFTPWLDFLRLAIAYALAFPIGWDREQNERSAGLRTFPLVAVASCGFVLATAGMMRDHPDAQARVVEGVITGIGFIGGGAILKGNGNVYGTATATAASLWGTGAVGVAVGLGTYDVALVLAVVIVLTLRLLRPLKQEKTE